MHNREPTARPDGNSTPGRELRGAGISRGLVLLMAVATGVAVANNYYAQPALATIEREFKLSSGVAGLIVTVSQAGYAAGLLLLLPLGDLFERRRLVVTLSLLSAAALAWVALSRSIYSLLPAAFTVGLFIVMAQILVPFAATLARDDERGRVVGTIMSGLLIGILLARTVAGYLAEFAGWRGVYWVAAVVMVVLAVVLQRALPRFREEHSMGYGALLRSTARLFLEEKTLRRRSLFGALAFGAFSVLWTTLAFLLAGPPYHLKEGAIGLFGLAGAAGAASAVGAGHAADRGHAHRATGLFSLAMLASYGAIAVGPWSILALVAGIVVLDLGVQGLHITNQSEVYRLRPEARSRINSVYMTTYFIGGAFGSAAAAFVYSRAGWVGSSVFGALFGAVALVLWLGGRKARA